jgi:hypothetical protein
MWGVRHIAALVGRAATGFSRWLQEERLSNAHHFRGGMVAEYQRRQLDPGVAADSVALLNRLVADRGLRAAERDVYDAPVAVGAHTGPNAPISVFAQARAVMKIERSPLGFLGLPEDGSLRIIGGPLPDPLVRRAEITDLTIRRETAEDQNTGALSDTIVVEVGSRASAAYHPDGVTVMHMGSGHRWCHEFTMTAGQDGVFGDPAFTSSIREPHWDYPSERTAHDQQVLLQGRSPSIILAGMLGMAGELVPQANS